MYKRTSVSLGKTPARAFAWISSYIVKGSLTRFACSSLQRVFPAATALSCASNWSRSGPLGNAGPTGPRLTIAPAGPGADPLPERIGRDRTARLTSVPIANP